MNTPLEPRDSLGNVITAGASVRIPVLPHWLVHDLPAEEVAVMRTVEGSVMRVIEIDAFGNVWFGMDNEGHWFCLRPDEVTIAFSP